MRFTRFLFIGLLFYFSARSQVGYNYYFGNLHAHTAFSDGNKDSLISGVGRPDGSYAYAKLSADFDFLGISEHNHYSSLHNPGFKLSRFQAGHAMANAANQEGTFLSLFGMEYGISSGNNGHVIIYGFNQLIGWENNVGGTSGNNYDIFNAKSDYDGLFKKIKNNTGAFAYLAHPYWTDFTRNGHDSTALAFSAYNATYDSAIVGLPLRSGNAFSTFTNYGDYATGDYFNYYKKLLNIGYHIGIGYDHDNHNTNFGRGNGGRLVIIAPSLTRANLTTAMQQMHFYGSDDRNAKLNFTLNNQIMGSVLNGNAYPVISVLHNDPDGEQADTIRIWRGNKSSGGLWAQVLQTTLSSNTSALTDQTIMQDIEYYYFVDVKQADGQWIVTSPVWYTYKTAASAKENTEIPVLIYFPNPVSGDLSVSMANYGDYILTIRDGLGRTLISEKVAGRDAVLNLSGISRGIYTLRVESGKYMVSKKLAVE